VDHLADPECRWSRIAFFGLRFLANVGRLSLGVFVLPNDWQMVGSATGSIGDGNAVAKHWNDNGVFRSAVYGGNVAMFDLAKHERKRR